MRISILTAILGVLLLVMGCASDGGVSNPFETSVPVPGGDYYFSEFADVPIPNDMSESKSDTYTSAQGPGLRSGFQKFSGRVDALALIRTMRRNMADHGWVLRSFLRSKESVLVFEKPDRVCSIQISDGMIYTDMRVFVSSRLEGDSGEVDYATSYPSQSLSQ